METESGHIGVSLLKTPHTESTWGELLRAIGFAYTPGILRVFGFIPVIGPIIAFAGTVLEVTNTDDWSETYA